jgi:hypothetical protein
MDKLNPVYHYWYYDKLKGQRVFTELGYHNYHKHYAEQFNDIRHSVKKVLEIGVFRGHSLLMWHDYFPNAEKSGFLNRSLCLFPGQLLQVFWVEGLNWLEFHTLRFGLQHRLLEVPSFM